MQALGDNTRKEKQEMINGIYFCLKQLDSFHLPRTRDITQFCFFYFTFFCFRVNVIAGEENMYFCPSPSCFFVFFFSFFIIISSNVIFLCFYHY